VSKHQGVLVTEVKRKTSSVVHTYLRRSPGMVLFDHDQVGSINQTTQR